MYVVKISNRFGIGSFQNHCMSRKKHVSQLDGVLQTKWLAMSLSPTKLRNGLRMDPEPFRRNCCSCVIRCLFTIFYFQLRLGCFGVFLSVTCWHGVFIRCESKVKMMSALGIPYLKFGYRDLPGCYFKTFLERTDPGVFPADLGVPIRNHPHSSSLHWMCVQIYPNIIALLVFGCVWFASRFVTVRHSLF